MSTDSKPFNAGHPPKQAGGYTSSMEAEVQNFKGLIQAIKNALR